MKFLTFADGAASRPGLLDGGEIVDLTGAGGSMLELIRQGSAGIARAQVAAKTGARRPLAGAQLLPPVTGGKVLCSGINYKSHMEENPNAKLPGEPFFFAKLPNAVVGHEARIAKPDRSAQVDYEVEFAVVIGKRLSHAPESAIMDAIFGYTLLNDVSARDVQFKDNQITLGKNFDGFAPLGPVISTPDELGDVNRVGLRSILNGQLMQNGSTADWLFPLPRLLSYLSDTITLEPGDVVTTGTPAGVGAFRHPPVWMKAGDVIEIEADGIGTLRNHLVAPGEARR
jgi:2-keto-4-pentenoate hydratase/2-oxohepta-3-ene-1,7-dioic acid hydratase in catechol pathway